MTAGSVFIFLVAVSFSRPAGCNKLKAEQDLRMSLMSNYSKDIKPGKEVSVDITLVFLSLKKVNTKEETMSSVGYLMMYWTDSRLTWESRNHENITDLFFLEKGIWRPPVVISNEVKQMNVIQNEAVAMRVQHDGLVEWSPPISPTTSCDLDIRYYPFDAQVCEIIMRSWLYNSNEMMLVAYDVDMSEFVSSGEWRVQNQMSEGEDTLKKGALFSTLKFKFYLKRRPDHYIATTIVPLILMSFLILVAFILPAESGERLPYCITLFLALVVLFSIIVDTLPTSSKSFSSLRIYIGMITGMAGMSVVFTAILSRTFHRDENEPISGLTKKITLVVEKLSCKRHASATTNAIKPRGSQSEKLNGNTLNENLTWKKINVIWEIFLYRFFLILILTNTVTFILFVGIPYQRSVDVLVSNAHIKP